MGTVTDPIVQGALRVATELPGLVDTWQQAPRQVLARLHCWRHVTWQIPTPWDARR